MDIQKHKKTFWDKIATFIVDKRNAFFLLFIGLIIFCIFSSQWILVNDSLIDYLPETTETRQGITLMEEEFVTYATAKVMVSNITLEEARDIEEILKNIEGISEVAFDNDRDHFYSASALFEVTFKGEVSDKICLQAMEAIKDSLSKYDLYISSEVGSSIADILDNEMRMVILISVLIIISVLLLTSKTYLEIPIMLATFGVAAILNVGTNFLLGEISFISDSIAIILQLALAIDYAIILSLVSVFLLMPGLLLVFSKGIDKTAHKNFVPSIRFWGKIVIKTKYILSPVFLILIASSFYFSSQTDYLYGYSKLTTKKQNEHQIAERMIKDTFGKSNLMALLVPTGDYDSEGKLIRKLESLEITDSVVGLANIEAGDDYIITDPLTPRQFSEMADLDIELARLIYSVYAINDEAYGQIINDLDNYAVPLIDIFLFMNNEKVSGFITLDDDLQKDMDDLYLKLYDAKAQLKGENYTRILLNTHLPEESDETFEWLDKLHHIAYEYYPEDVYLVGESTNNFDLFHFFNRDNNVIGITSAVFVMIVLLFTFQSAGLPVLLS